MKLRYLGHSCFDIRIKDKKILTDPFISSSARTSGIRADDLEADFILISHGHEDHVGDAAGIAKRCGSTVISNFEIVTWFEKQGVTGHGMNHGGKHTFPFGTVKCVHASHSSTLPDGAPGGNPGGFVIWNDEGCVYFAGDTSLSMDMQLIPMTCPKLTAAILPLGDNFTMGYEDALLAAQFVQCDRIVGCHFDTFDAIIIDRHKAISTFTEAGKELILLQIGDEMRI